MSTDGKWCYIVFWVVGKQRTRWSLLKKRLIEACPSCSSASGISYYRSDLQPSKPSDVFLLNFSCHDRKGLLHGNFLELMMSYLSFSMCVILLLLIGLRYLMESRLNCGHPLACLNWGPLRVDCQCLRMVEWSVLVCSHQGHRLLGAWDPTSTIYNSAFLDWVRPKSKF